MTADELQGTIEKAEAKRQAMAVSLPEAKQLSRALTLLPTAAALYQQQIEKGLDGAPTEALRARTKLRAMLGRISLEPGKDGSLWATCRFDSAGIKW
jgi:hypothetical protein